MILSLNQIEQTSRKAVRGAGLPWGLADDAGKAVRWLHIYRLNGAAELARLLDRHRRCHYVYREVAPESLAGVWRAPGGTLDPLVAGASLGDCLASASGTDHGIEIETGAIAHPLLAAGFIGNLAEIEDRAFMLSWPGVDLYCRRGGVRIAGERRNVETPTAAFMRCRHATSAKQGRCRAPRIGGAAVASKVWKRLERHAWRTYVEASDASRLAGAGAGLHDND